MTIDHRLFKLTWDTIVEYLKPAHIHFVDLVEPIPPVDFDHWVMDESELGWNTLLH